MKKLLLLLALLVLVQVPSRADPVSTNGVKVGDLATTNGLPLNARVVVTIPVGGTNVTRTIAITNLMEQMDGRWQLLADAASSNDVLAASILAGDGANTNHANAAAVLAMQSATNRADGQIAGLASVYQPLDPDLTAWAAVNPGSYSTTAEASALYQPLDSDLTAWAAVNPSSYSTSAQIASAYQPLDADLTGWAATPTNVLSAKLSSTDAAATYQPLDADLTAWAAVNPSSYSTTAQAGALYQPIGSYQPLASKLTSLATGDGSVLTNRPVLIQVAISDETNAITTGASKIRFRAPYAFTLTTVRASLTTSSSSGNPAFDINEDGVSVLSTTITIDAGTNDKAHRSSVTATTPPVISDNAIADDAEITIDIDTAGTGATGAKVTLIGYR